MSSQPKITSKNLSYSTDLPPFLAKLRGQQDQQRNSDTPDPILAARRRAARPRSASEEAEDAPLVVDEAGNAIAFPSADAPAEASDGGAVDGAGAGDQEKNEKDGQKEREKVAAIGAPKKRKVGRVVGGDEEDEPALRKENSSSEKNKSRKEPEHTADHDSKDAKSGSKQKKKAKKIKLSFGDDGD
ncbi:uncharacterized protein F4807DRAFT_438686 [Annulohypoxylon truncatum]|uniref:uncharacterized protein n=1 Tax=Annulohypoxylon truncatum TaxID=327061 RepID=UPI002007585E|nr:uncharacterized protein F4807DRAFT_438686 [Annulohypoxylon truncatum]KAI1206614.1 hypothetical protein F4807DRAFT_438686 [Annulohypoxylon truncatum]